MHILIDHEPCTPGCKGWAIFNGDSIQACDDCGVYTDEEAVALARLAGFAVDDPTGARGGRLTMAANSLCSRCGQRRGCRLVAGEGRWLCAECGAIEGRCPTCAAFPYSEAHEPGCPMEGWETEQIGGGNLALSRYWDGRGEPHAWITVEDGMGIPTADEPCLLGFYGVSRGSGEVQSLVCFRTEGPRMAALIARRFQYGPDLP